MFINASACNRPTGGTHATAADQSAAISLAATPSTNPSAIQYIASASGGEAVVAGTSTLHNWTVKTHVIRGVAEFCGKWSPAATTENSAFANSVDAVRLISINLVIPVDSLKSTEGSGMDDTMYDALKLKQFPTITYQLTKASLKGSPTGQSPQYHFDTTGELTVAGNTRAVNLDVAAVPHDDGQLTITAQAPLKMTDFGVKPPTAMLGMIKSGDAITVNVTLQLKMLPSEQGASR